MRRFAAIAAAILVIMLALGAGVARLRLQDPLASLPRDPPASVVVLEEWRERWQRRTLLHVALRGAAVRDVRFVVSLPDPVPAERMPLVIVLGGLRGGSRSIRQISEVVGDPGPNAFVGYDWPLPHEEPSGLEIGLRVPELRREVLSVPGQVDAILAWASRQPWADPGRVSLLGFSLGAFVAPAVQRLAAERGAAVHWTILAYGGAPIGAVIAGHPAVKPRWAGRLLGAGADLLLRPIEPGEHLPHLRGRFLVLRAAKDRLIAPAAAARLADLTPEPRRIVVIEGDHMGVGTNKSKLLEKVVMTSRAWMIEQGAIAPATTGESRSGAPVRGRRGASFRGAKASILR
jgi:dienelactone hydrolase